MTTTTLKSSQDKRLIDDACAYAIEAHKGQRYGKLPYDFHLRAVVAALGPDAPAIAVAAAWLHDVVEDTHVMLYDVRDQFGGQVARLVDCVTDGEGESREVRKAAMYRKLTRGPSLARRIKLADRIANMEASIENPKKGAEYRDEFPEFIKLVGRDEENQDLVLRLFWLYLASTEAQRDNSPKVTK